MPNVDYAVRFSNCQNQNKKIGSKNKIQIKPARLDDMTQIAEFIRSSAEWYKKFIDPKDKAEHDVDEEWMQRNYFLRRFYIGYNNNKAIGTISMQQMGEYAYLGYIYLDAKQVGKGYGHELIQFAEDKARSEGYSGLCLIAHPEATWATKAYLKYGFEITATKRHHVLTWNKACMKQYYEEGFELYTYRF